MSDNPAPNAAAAGPGPASVFLNEWPNGPHRGAVPNMQVNELLR